jgi:hypothetical protein
VSSTRIQDSARSALFAALLVCAAAIVPYLSTIDDYFVRDDFGVVQLLSRKPPSYFPRWFVSSWMDEIWGYVPDEIRPFPAASYQLTALGGEASPELHHVLNILIHALNGLLVLAIARVAASLSLPAATFAAVVFVLLPVHSESVAWITGRVDSMPALFYLASFLAYVRSRQRESPRLYLVSLAIFFVALFTKQNTITMVGTLVAYDLIVARRPIRPWLSCVAPYVPFVAMTLAYLWLRYALFGEVAREGTLNARGLRDFLIIVARHIKYVVSGQDHGSTLVVWEAMIALLVVTGASIRWRAQSRIATLLYFGPVWWLIGIAPILVAGYYSPRHVYLAAVGWAMVIGMTFDMLWTATTSWRRAAVAFAAVVLVFYSVGLYASVREWNRTAAVSHTVVRDVRSTALSAPEGSLVIVGAPGRSWEWALPFSVRPPFVRTDLTQRVFIISPRALSCCTAPWFEQTRKALREWSAGRNRGVAVALRWDTETGALSRATATDTPQLPVLARALLEMKRPEELDQNLRRMLDILTVPVR